MALSKLEKSDLTIKILNTKNSKDKQNEFLDYFNQVKKKRDEEEIKEFINEINYITSKTLLQNAVVSGTISIVEILIENGGNINIKNTKNNNCLNLAIMNDRLEMFDFLIEQENVELNDKMIYQTVNSEYKLPSENSAHMIEKLIEKGCKGINFINENSTISLSHTPLFEVVSSDKKWVPDIVKILLDNGATISDDIIPKINDVSSLYKDKILELIEKRQGNFVRKISDVDEFKHKMLCDIAQIDDNTQVENVVNFLENYEIDINLIINKKNPFFEAIKYGNILYFKLLLNNYKFDDKILEKALKKAEKLPEEFEDKYEFISILNIYLDN